MITSCLMLRKRHCNWCKVHFHCMSPSASVCEGTMKTIANLVQCKDKVLTVNLMNTAKQTGVADCGLDALAVATCLLHIQDPTSVVFNQEELRTHFCQSLEKGKASLFPVKKMRRVSRICKKEQVSVYCYCRMPEGLGMMVNCRVCEDWFHTKCIKEKVPEDTEQWDFTCSNGTCVNVCPNS